MAAVFGGKRKHKAVLLGDAGVGKSALFQTVRRLKMADATGRNDASAHNHREGYGAEVNYKTKVDDTEILFTLWDTGGVERFRTMTKNYYHSSSVFIFVYSTHSRTSLDNLFAQIKEAKAKVPEALSILVGNVYDSQEASVPTEAIDHVAEENNISRTLRFQLSAISGEEVQQLLQTIAEHLASDQSSTDENEIVLSQPSSLDPTHCYCC